MTVTIQGLNSIGTGIQFTFAADGDSYVILPGVTVGSTVQAVINFNNLANLTLDIGGSLISASLVTVSSAGSSVSIGAEGRLVSLVPNSGSAALFLVSNNSRLDNAGEIFGAQSIGVLSIGLNDVYNSGKIAGASGVFLGLNGGVGDRLVNSGEITASRRDDDIRSTRFNNAVFAEGANTQITNKDGGTVTAISSEGAGVRLGLGSNGSTVLNAGLIEATTWFGVDFSTMGALETGSLTNFGTIRGGAGAFNGAVSADIVINRGTMVGQVVLGNGADLFDGIGGTVSGTVFGGLGEDVYRLSDPLARVFEASGAGVADRIESTASYSLATAGEVENLTLIGDAVRAVGNAVANLLIGNLQDNVMLGGGGNDTISGGEGDDKVRGGVGSDLIMGEDGEDHLIGGDSFDTLFGGAGEDTLLGDGGRDFLFGGADTDQFRFRFVSDSVAGSTLRDVIVDFQTGIDVVDLAAIDANTARAGNQAFSFIGTAAFSLVAGQMRFVASVNSVLQGDVNGDGLADFVVQLNTLATINVNDLVL